MYLKYTEMFWNRLFQCFSIQKYTKKAYFSRFQYVLALCTFSDIVLFVYKTDDFLQLYVNYRDLNKIYRKNRYSLSLLINLLGASQKV